MLMVALVEKTVIIAFYQLRQVLIIILKQHRYHFVAIEESVQDKVLNSPAVKLKGV